VSKEVRSQAESAAARCTNPCASPPTGKCSDDGTQGGAPPPPVFAAVFVPRPAPLLESPCVTTETFCTPARRRELKANKLDGQLSGTAEAACWFGVNDSASCGEPEGTTVYPANKTLATVVA
jgi:hypothetical protein